MSSFKKLHRKEYAKLNSLILKSKCQKNYTLRKTANVYGVANFTIEYRKNIHFARGPIC